MIKKVIFFSFIIFASLLGEAYAQNSIKKFAEFTISEISALKKQQELLFLKNKKLDICNKDLSKYMSIMAYIRGFSEALGASYTFSSMQTKTLDENIYKCIVANTEKIIKDIEGYINQKKLNYDATLLQALMYRTSNCMNKNSF